MCAPPVASLSLCLLDGSPPAEPRVFAAVKAESVRPALEVFAHTTTKMMRGVGVVVMVVVVGCGVEGERERGRRGEREGGGISQRRPVRLDAAPLASHPHMRLFLLFTRPGQQQRGRRGGRASGAESPQLGPQPNFHM
ncbi:unnamed protein product [Pleuronectes platessa]|uniref:Uncharacterized protein n=1 Tax=Pleuronectes platessa TaxID=8262 RepID=A0A9N7UYN7_PLEPL|nr:unnamed protein product [Pleuronectes platessa]